MKQQYMELTLGNLRLICALTDAKIHQKMQADAKENG